MKKNDVAKWESAERRHRAKAAQARRGSLRKRWHLWAAGECRRRKREAMARIFTGRAGWVVTLPVRTGEDSERR